MSFLITFFSSWKCNDEFYTELINAAAAGISILHDFMLRIVRNFVYLCLFGNDSETGGVMHQIRFNCYHLDFVFFSPFSASFVIDFTAVMFAFRRPLQCLPQSF